MLGLNFFVILLASYFVISKCECDLEEFEKADIVPNIVPEVPKKSLEVKYTEMTINCGDRLIVNPSNHSVLASLPSITYDADDDDFYTLFMIGSNKCEKIQHLQALKPFLVGYEEFFENIFQCPTTDAECAVGSVYDDPDAPYPKEPTYAEFLHWYVINIPGGNMKKGSFQQPYFPPTPPADSPAHRYIFVLCQQPGKLEDYNYGSASRIKFNMTRTIEELKLTITAGNFFYVKTEGVESVI